VILNLAAFTLTVVLLVLIHAFCRRGDHFGDTLHQLSAFLAAAVRRNFPLGQALRAFESELPGLDPLRRRDVLRDVADRVESGQTFSAAMEEHETTFPAFYRALVRAGERAGNLGGVFARVSEAAAAESRSWQAPGYAFYPLYVAAIALSQLVLIGWLILPKFFQMFQEMGLPLRPELRLATHFAFPTFCLMLVVGTAAVRMLPLPRMAGPLGRLRLALAPPAGWIRWHTPLLSRYERRLAASRYALAAGTLLEAGVPTAEAFRIAATASGSPYFDRIARGVAERVEEGERVSSAFKAADGRRELSPEFHWYVEVGEGSGDLPEAFLRASENQAMRSRSALGVLVKLIPPASILVLGFFVGTLGHGFFAALLDIMKGLGL
jgi:type II secretory pathway component PulF